MATRASAASEASPGASWQLLGAGRPPTPGLVPSQPRKSLPPSQTQSGAQKPAVVQQVDSQSPCFLQGDEQPQLSSPQLAMVDIEPGLQVVVQLPSAVQAKVGPHDLSGWPTASQQV